MTELYKVLGPPGCGKTTYGARQMRRAASRYGRDKVLGASLTKAAAYALVSKDTELPDEQLGTLHSHCYHGLGRPKLVERKHIEEWNSLHPRLALSLNLVTSGKAGPEEFGGSRGNEGDATFRRVELYRSRMVDPSLWSAEAVYFYNLWREWKDDGSLVDFTDLIERAIGEMPFPPGNAQALFVDEAQDLSRLELTLIKRWAATAEVAILIGDPDQALYHWRGASKDILAGDPWKILDQSYRVPESVVREALNFLETGVADRIPVKYLAKKDDAGNPVVGSVERRPWQYAYDPSYLEEVEELADECGSAMVVTSCEFMLTKIKGWLRSEGVPYHNPYSVRWNPLRASRGTAMAQRVAALLAISKYADKPRDYWTATELALWAPVVKAYTEKSGVGVFLNRKEKSGVVEAMKSREEWTKESLRFFVELSMREDAVARIRDGDLGYIRDCLTAQAAKTADYPLRIVERRGLGALADTPKLVIGTIHSVKGGEAGAVVVFPDLSPSGYRSYRTPGWATRDATFRLFYVAMTRAQEKLIICNASSGMAATL